MPPRSQHRRPIYSAVLAAAIIPVLSLTIASTGANASAPRVLLVGTYNSIAGQYSNIEGAVAAAKGGDWILSAGHLCA